MTKPLPFSKASLKRRIAAAREAGLRVVGIAADGTVRVDESGFAPTARMGQSENAPHAGFDQWGDVQA